MSMHASCWLAPKGQDGNSQTAHATRHLSMPLRRHRQLSAHVQAGLQQEREAEWEHSRRANGSESFLLEQMVLLAAGS